MKGKRRFPKISIALVLAAVVLAVGGTVLAATNAPDIISEDYKAEFELDHIDVALVENGVESKDLDSKTLLSQLDGKVQPGRVYKEELAAKNIGDVPEVVRMIVRVFWEDADGNKTTKLDPELIELTYGDQPYNTGAWQINDQETTDERKVYYLSSLLAGGDTSDPVVDQLRLNNKVLDDVTVSEEKKGNKTVYTYEYEYNGYQVCVEADLQSVQAHNPNEAIKSSWGVQNVTVSGNKVTVG